MGVLMWWVMLLIAATIVFELGRLVHLRSRASYQTRIQDRVARGRCGACD